MESKIENSIKTFAKEAGRFKLEDLANILGVGEDKVWNILINLVSSGEIEGSFANNNTEFVIKQKLKKEIITILDNPSLINHNMVKTCSKCKTSLNYGAKFCPSCGEPVK